jgi:hypothetical protein
MTPGDHALEEKIKSIEEEVELKINSPANFAAAVLFRSTEPVRDHTVGATGRFR